MGVVDDNTEMDSNKETSLMPKEETEREWSKNKLVADREQRDTKDQGHQDQNDNELKMNKKEEEVNEDGQDKEGLHEFEAKMKKDKGRDNRDGVSNDHSKQGQDDTEERMKKKEAEIERANAAEASASMPVVYHDDPGSGNEMEIKFIPENKHLRGASFTTNSRGGTPNTARKRRHQHHHGNMRDEINMVELISLSGLESICTMSNYDAMSTKDLNVDEEMGDVEGEEEKGIGVHHVVAVVLAVASVAIILLLFFLVPCPCEPADWDVELQSMVSKSPVRLLDVNRDGMEDIIVGYGNSMDYTPIEDMDQYCQSMNVSSPCGGGVIALSGWRGDTIWELRTNQTITGLVCNQQDTNGDGQNDCFASGYDGQLLAIDSKTGTVLWTADQSVTVPTWSYYQPQTLPRDLDGDGVLDLVVTHGPETSSDQGPGRLILISSQTGKALGSFLEMPDSMTTRGPPVIYQQTEEEEEDATPYIIFGSGSSSAQGSMWMISLDHIFCQVTGSDCSEVILQYDHPVRSSQSDHVMSSVDKPVIELVRGSGSGFDLPAVIADLSQDGVSDLIMVSHGALVMAVNGSDLQPLWSVERYVGSYQITSVPAPGHFDSDDVPDILLHLNPLDSSADLPDKIVILNGTNGEEIWATLSMSNDLSPLTRYSPLNLRADEDKDVFAFWVSSVEDNEITTQSVEDRCSDFSLSRDSLSLLFMDRDLVTSPSVLYSTSSYVQSINSSDSASTGQVTTLHPITTLGKTHMTLSASEGHSPTTIMDITTIVGSQSETPSPSHPNTSSPQHTNPSTPPLATQTASTSLMSTAVRGQRRRRDLGNQEVSGCYKMMPVVTSTGVIGDFDDDGSLELIILMNTVPLPLSVDGDISNPSMTPTTTIQRFGLMKAFGLDQRLDLVQEDTFLGPGLKNMTVTGDLQNHFNFLRIGKQPWMGYMGTDGDSVYSLA